MTKGSRSRLHWFSASIVRPLRLGIEKLSAIPKAAGQWLDAHHEEIFDALDKLERLVRHLTSRFLPPRETAALTAAGWTPFGWSLEEIRGWGGLALAGGEDAVNASICAAYRANGWVRLDQLADSMYASRLLARRAHLIREAVATHKQGLYAASIPLLISQLEGATRDAVDLAAAEVVRVETEDDVDRLIVIADASPWKTSALDNLHRLDSRGLSVFAGQVYLTRLRELYARYLPADQTIPPGSRHAILHGADVAYPSEALSLQLLLLLEGLPTAVLFIQLAAAAKAAHAALIAYSEAEAARVAAERSRAARRRPRSRSNARQGSLRPHPTRRPSPTRSTRPRC